MSIYKLYFDGSCGPKNPGGIAAYGYVLLRAGEEQPIETGSGVIGTGAGMSNNLAEFYALQAGLRSFIKQAYTGTKYLQVYGDSNLVIQIMNKHWKAKSDKLYFPAYEMADHILREVRRSGVTVTFDWIPREQNTLCDDLSKAHNKID